MLHRRAFLRHAAATGVVCVGCALRHAAAQPATPARRQVTVAGQRVRTVDVHAHAAVPAVLDVVTGTRFERPVRRQLEGNLGFPVADARVSDMNSDGVDVQALSINAFWYEADRDLARRIYDVQAKELAQMCKFAADRFVGYAPVTLQFPDLAAEQLEHGMKDLGFVGAGIAGTVAGEELASPKFDPFWRKAEELRALIFLHPLNGAAESTGVAKRVQGSGALGNVIGNPLETTIALSHMIFEGTFDKFPNLKLCAAHGGGYLPSYAARMDHGCEVFPSQCKGPKLKKKPSEYLKQIYVDSLVFTGEALRHLVAEHGSSQIMLGTNSHVPWVKDPVDYVLNAPLTDSDKIAILGGNAAKLIKLPA